MTARSDAMAIGLLKAASKASTVLDIGERGARALKGLAVGATDLGAGVAKGLGAPELAGRIAGGTALAGGAYLTGKRVKRKADELKFRLMYGDQGMYY